MSSIIDILEATRATFCPSIYHNYGGLNVLTDEMEELENAQNIFALFTQSTQSDVIIEGRSVTERYSLNVAFCRLMPNDSYDAEDVELNYITPCKELAHSWLSWLIAKYPHLQILEQEQVFLE